MATLCRDSAVAYHGTKALSNSGISRILDCPAKFKFWDESPHEQTDSMFFGSFFHSLVLEPEQCANIYQVFSGDLRTKAGKEEKGEIVSQGRVPIKEDLYRQGQAMLSSLQQQPLMNRLLSSNTAMKESSIYWTENVAGVQISCKARLDYFDDINSYGQIVLDLKTTDNAAPERLSHTIWKWGYFRQAHWYMRALKALDMEPKDFLFAFVEKEPPHLCTICNLCSAAIELGGTQCEKALKIYANCLTSKVWPGYPKEIIPVNLEEWMIRKEILNDE